MSISPDKRADLRAAHLANIQSVINRLASNSASVKNYGITTATAVAGLAITLKNPDILLVAVFSSILLGLMDAKYLYIERQFRELYKNVAGRDILETCFHMNIGEFNIFEYLPNIFRWSISAFYGGIIIGVFAIYVTMKDVGG